MHRVWRSTNLTLLALALSAAASPLGACDAEPAEAPGPQVPEVPEPAPPPDPADAPSGEAVDVTFRTGDGVTVAATLRPGPVPAAPAVVLVHQLGSTRAEWAPIVERLSAEPGLTTLAIDMRGHGDSRTGPEGTLEWNDFADAEWAEVVQDVRAAVDFLRNQETLSPSKIALAGSSIGSSAAIRLAAEDADIAAVVALSPGRAYRGVDAVTPVAEFGDRPLLAVAAEGEPPAAATARDIARIAAAGEVVLYPGDAHGLAMIGAAPQMPDRVVTFLRNALGAGAPPHTEDAP